MKNNQKAKFQSAIALILFLTAGVLISPYIYPPRAPLKQAVAESARFELDVRDPEATTRTPVLIVLSNDRNLQQFLWLKQSSGYHTNPVAKHLGSHIASGGSFWVPQFRSAYDVDSEEFGYGDQWLYAPPPFTKWVIARLNAAKPTDH